MATQYNFNDKYIECETWPQVLRLVVLAKDQGYKYFIQDKTHFDNGKTIFYTYVEDEELRKPFGSAICRLDSINGAETIKYTDFINAADQTDSTVEITGCKGCPLYTRLEQHDYQYCSYPGKEQSCQLFVDMFANCPVKEKSITIKIKQ